MWALVMLIFEYKDKRAILVTSVKVGASSPEASIKPSGSNVREGFERDKLIPFNDPRKLLPYPRVLAYTLNRHMEEFCPDNIHSCWCGMLERYDCGFTITFNPSFPRDLTILCEKRPYVFILDESRQANSGLISKLQVHKVEQQLRVLPTSAESSLGEDQFYKHNDSYCEPEYKWCWCGLVRNLNDYFGVLEESHHLIPPRIMIDCRPYKMRPFEQRICDPSEISWYRKLITSDSFPCGRYWNH